jgi:hypothetical protein
MQTDQACDLLSAPCSELLCSKSMAGMARCTYRRVWHKVSADTGLALHQEICRWPT